MQRATVTSSPVDEEDWHNNGHTPQHNKSSPPPPQLVPPARIPSLPTTFPHPPPAASHDHHSTQHTKQEDTSHDHNTATTHHSPSPLPYTSTHTTTNGSHHNHHSSPGTTAADTAALHPYLIYSLSSPSEPLGVIDCSPLASLASLRHTILDELVSELSSPHFVFLYRGVKLTERQEQVKTVSNIAQRVDGTQADEAVYIRYSSSVSASAAAGDVVSSGVVPPPLIAAAAGGGGVSQSGVSSSARLSFDQLSYMEMLLSREAAAKHTPQTAAGSGETLPPRRKRGRPPKRRFDENGVEITDSFKRERLSAPPAMQLSHSSHTDTQPPLIPPPHTSSSPLDTTTTQHSTPLDTTTANHSTLALLPLLSSPTASMPGSPKRRNRRTHAALMASWLAGDKGVKRCFTCGRVMTAGQQKQHRCDMEAEERQMKWRAERQDIMARKIGGEIVIIGADATDNTSTGVAGEKEDGRRTRWRKLRAQRDEEHKTASHDSASGSGGELRRYTEEKEETDAGDDSMQQMTDEGDSERREGDATDEEEEDGDEHDSGDTEDEEGQDDDGLDDLPPLLQAQQAMEAVQAVTGAVKLERGENGHIGERSR